MKAAKPLSISMAEYGDRLEEEGCRLRRRASPRLGVSRESLFARGSVDKLFRAYASEDPPPHPVQRKPRFLRVKKSRTLLPRSASAMAT